MKRLFLISIPLVVLFTSFLHVQEKGTQKALYKCTDPALIDSTLFDVQAGKIYFSFNQKLKPKGLKAKGFVWLEDEPKAYFTAYLINTSDSSFKADRQDGSLIMIQEAMDKEGKWQPIEYWVYSGCGNSYFYPLDLASGKYVMIPIKKYSGRFKTKLRLKMKLNNSSLFYSEPFEGRIDKRQFKKEKKHVDGILYHGPGSYLELK